MNCLYLHIPFCRARCRYCSFSSYPGLAAWHDSYAAALRTEIGGIGGPDPAPLDTVFVGGGTPTVLAPEVLAAVLAACRDRFGFAPDAERTVEANPETVDEAALGQLRRIGFNRLSLGVQSFADRELTMLGRLHDGATAGRVISAARQAGFANLSLDMMYGLPEQTAAAWRVSLERALGAEPDHLSVYQLSVDDGTEFGAMAAAGRLALPAEEEIAEMDAITAELCPGAGLIRYEIANYARPGFRCRHNLNYWRNGPYLACGAGAVSFVAGVRARRISDPIAYCRAIERGREFIAEREMLDPAASFRESVVMGLRLCEGVAERDLLDRYGMGFAQVYGDDRLAGLADRGLVRLSGGRLALTGAGLRLANRVMAELV